MDESVEGRRYVFAVFREIQRRGSSTREGGEEGRRRVVLYGSGRMRGGGSFDGGSVMTVKADYLGSA